MTQSDRIAGDNLRFSRSMELRDRVHLSGDSAPGPHATISVHGLRLRTFIGFNPEEQAKQQDVVINMEIRYRMSAGVLDDNFGASEMVKVSDISLMSTCEHHFVTIDGVATVAYVPGERVIGLSKINRVVRFFGQRPQVQERLTRQILVALQVLLETEDVAVAIDATHFCVKSRGVMDTNSKTSTSAFGGCFKDDARARADFLC